MNYLTPDPFAPVGEETARAIIDAVEPYKDVFGIDDLQLTPTEDHDGDPVIYARFKHHLVEPPPSARSIWAMEGVIRDVVRQRGERRFVHIRHDYADEQTLDFNQ